MHGVMQHQRLQRSCGFTLSHLIYQIFKIKESETGASEEKIDRTLFFVYNLYIIHKQNENKNVLGSSCILGKWEEIQKEKIKMIRILVVEDDEKLNQIVCTYLNDSGFQAKGCLSAAAAYEEMYHTVYQLIISDIMMPEIDGFEFAGTVRRINETIPILFMSAKDDLPSKRKGFQLGIDDYMGNLILDADAMSAEIDGEEISLTTREFNIIYKLLSYPKKTFSRAQLMDEFWGVETDTSLRAVDVYVTKLRDKLSACDGFKIVTVRGLGYKVVLQ